MSPFVKFSCGCVGIPPCDQFPNGVLITCCDGEYDRPAQEWTEHRDYKDKQWTELSRQEASELIATTHNQCIMANRYCNIRSSLLAEIPNIYKPDDK